MTAHRMTSSKPYLIRAIYDWIVDNDLTPHVVINAFADGVQIPESYVENGQITLNISPTACRGLHLDNDKILFSICFSGIATQIYATPASVLSLYAQENGRGMSFGAEDMGDPLSPPSAEAAPPLTTHSETNGKEKTKDKSKGTKGRPNLKVVK